MSVSLPIGGAVDVALTIPNAPAFLGQLHFLQVLGVGLDAQLQIVELTGTHALALTIGSF